MPLLAANRRALATRFPEVLRLLESVAPVANPPASTAEETPGFIDEAARCSRLCLVLTGLPGPATTAALLRRCPREILFWCVEPAAEALAARLSAADCSVWLADPRVFLSLGAPAAPELRRLNRELAWVDRARALFLPTRYAGREADWKPVLAATLSRIQQRWQNVLTDLKLAPVRWENTCANLPTFLASPAIDSLAGAFIGAPLVLVAAGPSLDDALPFLQRVAPHALIVTGNTSFRAIAAHGLSPHLTVTVDPFPATDLGYDNCPLGNTHLVSPVFGYSGVHRRFAGRLFGMTDQSPLLARLRSAAGLPPAPPLLGEATVSSTVLNLAAYFGCTRVVFVGQDFAIADDGRSHASDTFYTDLGINRHDHEQVHRLPGTTRPEVTVPARHLWYLRTVEGHIARAPHIRHLNTSHRGAAIAGAPYMTYDRVATELLAQPARDYAAEIAARHSAAIASSAAAAMSAELDHARAAIRDAFELSLTAALSGELALADPEPAARQRFEAAAARFEQWRAAHQAEQPLLFEGRTKAEIFDAEKRRVALPAATDRALREAGEIAWAFAEGAASVHRQLATVALPTAASDTAPSHASARATTASVP
ncbi:MAG TPA: 6-hydroxymethylpterin diphosphokinase MptE-like protein [Opitutaceae bacterium]|nr:6-hydroxymethylpterin diphosphokinase MptE-like protein [Opitutaceae bacterium]